MHSLAKKLCTEKQTLDRKRIRYIIERELFIYKRKKENLAFGRVFFFSFLWILRTLSKQRFLVVTWTLSEWRIVGEERRACILAMHALSRHGSRVFQWNFTRNENAWSHRSRVYARASPQRSRVALFLQSIVIASKQERRKRGVYIFIIYAYILSASIDFFLHR